MINTNSSSVVDFRIKYRHMKVLLSARFSLAERHRILIKNQPYPGIAAFLTERKLVERFGSYINKIYSKSCAFFPHTHKIPHRNM